MSGLRDCGSLAPRLASVAARQVRDYDTHRPGTIFQDPTFALTIGEAYAVQLEAARLRSARGERVAGYKIGCVSRAVREQLGTEHAVFGHLFRGEMLASPASLDASDFCELGIEGEVAVRLARDLSDLDALREFPGAFVAEALPVIELHNYVLRGPAPRAAEVVANNALQAGTVVPEGSAAPWQGGDLGLRVRIGDRVDDHARVDPCATVFELASRLASYGITPRAGQVLLTGSPLPLYRVARGERICVHASDGAEVLATVA